MLHEMSWDEAAEYFRNNEVAILPAGSNEQHGRHAPLGTDHFIAKALAEEAAERTGVLCLQAISFGVSFVHRQFWGTISIPPQYFKDYVEDVCRSLIYYGIRRIVIVNGHGGNSTASSAEKGKEVFEAVVKELVAHIQLVKEAKPGELREKPRRD